MNEYMSMSDVQIFTVVFVAFSYMVGYLLGHDHGASNERRAARGVKPDVLPYRTGAGLETDDEVKR